MAFDVFSSVRATALVTIVAASFSSPIIVKSDAFADASARLTGGSAAEVEPTEQLVAGGVEFELPESWGRLRPASSTAPDTERIGTVVTGVCPGGGAGTTCTDGTSLTFVAYTGKRGHELPKLTEFQEQLDGQLRREFTGFRAGDAKVVPSADGIRYLDYTFTWGGAGAKHHQRIAAYRHDDGAGVVVMATGPALAEHDEDIDAFLAGAREPGADHD